MAYLQLSPWAICRYLPFVHLTFKKINNIPSQEFILFTLSQNYTYYIQYIGT